MEKVLYISDLDGTLLNSKQELSAKTIEVLNRCLENEHFAFTIASARSHASSKQILEPLNLTLPRILYNGAVIYDALNDEYVGVNGFSKLQAKRLLDLVLSYSHALLVYTIVSNHEEVRYIEVDKYIQYYLNSRKDDPRMHRVSSLDKLYEGHIFYLTLISTKDKLEPLYNLLKQDESLSLLFGQDVYDLSKYWLEIKAKDSTKAKACLFLKEKYGYQKLVCFGDSYNDLDMFAVCEQSYAVENASAKLKAKATAVIDKNDESGVAKFFLTTANI